ncbi:branched-chain amino acid ABC transporter permease [Bradyrhizobium sp. SK17]|uniref:branched-chain amino acid ABC transporter permease n=1 Tax=Bradyrhizobium sp. SK17 TaxID=2057741 RepID=UPI000C3177C2|nr:branched-chain amino acid ABC transporter permease [Bradyrhizobium sp. SK17]AUC95543.1 branched-chain amino acid ABC transporter permease [Bradyrhizobium sp. SK17]
MARCQSSFAQGPSRDEYPTSRHPGSAWGRLRDDLVLDHGWPFRGHGSHANRERGARLLLYAWHVPHCSGACYRCFLLVGAPRGTFVAVRIGASTERLLLRHAKSHFHDLLLTFSLFFLVNETVLWVWGAQPLPVPGPDLLSGSLGLPFGRYPIYRLFVLATSSALAVLLLFLFLRTLAGVTVRAVVADPGMAEALGINTSRVRMIVFGAGTALAGLAGCLSGPIFQADPSLASTSLMSMFIVVVLGGFGSVTGALVASLAMGQVQTWSIMFLPDMAAAGPLVLFIAVLAWRPQGLLGERA